MTLCIAMGGSVLLENPASSYMFDTKFFREFVRMLKRVGIPVACLDSTLLHRSVPGLMDLLLAFGHLRLTKSTSG